MVLCYGSSSKLIEESRMTPEFLIGKLKKKVISVNEDGEGSVFREGRN